jgi:phosphate transport system protein
MPQKEHTFTRFDDELNAIRAGVQKMGELVKIQFQQSVLALLESDPVISQQVREQYYAVEQLSKEIDRLCVTAIARQQPTASDLRLILVATKVVVNLERIGHEANKIARIAEKLAQQQLLVRRRYQGIRLAANLAQQELAEITDCIARLDTVAARRLQDSENVINEQFNAIFRDLIQSMTEDPRMISSSLDILFVAKAIERVGNCIRHISKLVIITSSRYGEIESEAAAQPADPLSCPAHP